jgi:hypothetical protein
METDIEENKRKGDEFEKWVVKKFDTAFFKVGEWRSDKYVDGIYPESNHFPDLEINFCYKKKNITKTFAVECKWRKSFYKGGINWAKGYQVKYYTDYASRLEIPVFVILGVGKEPSDPEKVFIIPLKDIKNDFLTDIELKPYLHNDIKGNFFFDYEKLALH